MDGARVVLAPRVVGDLVHGARPVERIQRDEVVELGRAHLLEPLAHALGLELEHADRVPAGEHLVGADVVEGQRRHVRPRAGGALDDVQGVLDHVEVAQPEEVHLQQADLLDRLHRVLRHRAVDALAVGVGPRRARRLGELQRHDVGQRAVGDHDRRGMDRGVADDALQPPGDVDDLLGRGLGVVGDPQGLAGREAVLERGRAAHDGLRDQLGQPVTGAVVVAQDARRVAGRGARLHLAEGDDLSDPVGAVLLRHVADHALAPADREVDVDVGHRHPLGIEEALEQQPVAQRIDVGYRQAVGDDRSRRRPASGADGDPVLLGVAHEVPHDQEVGGEPHALDHAELHLGPFAGFGGDRVAIAQPQSLPDARAQILVLFLASRCRVAGDELAPELELDRAPLGDLERAGQRLGPLGERAGHFLVGAQEELVGLKRELGRGQRALGLHAQQRGVVVVVLPAQVVHVAGSHQGAAQLAGDADDSFVGLVLGGDAIGLDLEVDVVGTEGTDQLIGVRPGVSVSPFHQPGAKARGQAAGQGDHPVRATVELREVKRRLASLKAFEKPGRAELDQIAVSRVRGRQQRQVVALAALGDPGVVVDEIDLAAHDRLDPVPGAGLVQLDGAIHHPVVGEGEGGLLEGGRALDQAVDLAGTVEQGVLGVHVEMGAGGRAQGHVPS